MLLSYKDGIVGLVCTKTKECRLLLAFNQDRMSSGMSVNKHYK